LQTSEGKAYTWHEKNEHTRTKDHLSSGRYPHLILLGNFMDAYSLNAFSRAIRGHKAGNETWKDNTATAQQSQTTHPKLIPSALYISLSPYKPLSNKQFLYLSQLLFKVNCWQILY
jgi:hypothetical protein